MTKADIYRTSERRASRNNNKDRSAVDGGKNRGSRGGSLEEVDGDSGSSCGFSPPPSKNRTVGGIFIKLDEEYASLDYQAKNLRAALVKLQHDEKCLVATIKEMSGDPIGAQSVVGKSQKQEQAHQHMACPPSPMQPSPPPHPQRRMEMTDKDENGNSDTKVVGQHGGVENPSTDAEEKDSGLRRLEHTLLLAPSSSDSDSDGG